MKKFISIFLVIFSCQLLLAHAWGVVLDQNGEPLVGANVYWAHTTFGTSTDINGEFELEPVHTTKLLVTSYVGYHNDTTEVKGHSALTIVLVDNEELDEVTILERKMAVIKSRTSALNTESITGEALCKAACCNLSESFEQSASVDVAYSDAATGAKQIRLLGLSGTYVQLLSENTPGVRGLAQNFGLEYIPGPWMASIQVSKGTSSVINGYEATSGQINVEYLKPQTQDPIAVNAMLNTELHAEVNIEGGGEINENVSTGVLAHYQCGQWPMDDNHDSFLDMPLNHNLNLLNRWYFTKGHYTGQILVRGLYDQRIGGQHTKFLADENPYDPYKIDLRTRRIDGFIKNGYVFDEESGMSIGIIAAASYHNQTNLYGGREWDAAQTNAYLNAIFQTNFGDDHKLSAGLSVNFDKYNETLTLPVSVPENNFIFDRMETTPGIFAEYTYTYTDKLTLLLGLRGDYSTRYGFFVTPRMNVRYSPWTWWNIRASVGMGYRSPNLIADNAAYLPSGREWNLHYGYNLQDQLNQEKALNTGITTTFYIPIADRELQLSGEYYYTHFFDCVIADIDQSMWNVNFYNLSDINGRSFAQNIQVEATMEILRGWTMTLAYRQTDIKQTSFNGTEFALMEKPLTNKFKGIITTSYQTPLKKWQFDFTAQFNGSGRMPIGFVPTNSDQYTQKDGIYYHKWYPQLMAQITKYWRSCSLYVGSENMTNFRQENPILGADFPFGTDFDASMVWGPIHGWKVYVGFRWSLAKQED